MIKLELMEDGKKVVHEQAMVPFGAFSKVLAFDANQKRREVQLQNFSKKMERGPLSDADEKKYLDLQDAEKINLEEMVKLVAELFKDDSVTTDAIMNGLSAEDGMDQLQSVLQDAMGRQAKGTKSKK
ncbi:hypothetical protein [Lactobacillus agilis] [Lactiplantibacillus mudanjiangensis]|uniref:phage tail assembly chaperone G n=1 Tax=Lactiplantibacillus mudanjiangensis TaxID=1296538 RepID=UPI0010152EB7|nr:hypothetical protein [Lactobacillus agilis] [Lactiplantibacillus mudanjiangensis]